MKSTIAAEKAALRMAVKEISLSDKERKESDDLLFARFLVLPQVAQAGTLLLFYGVGTEPDTARLLGPLTEAGKVVALPRCLPGGRMEARRYCGPEHLIPGAFGIPEPDLSCPVIQREELDLILVPNLCCDKNGHRLGHGGGYYDRFLSGCAGCTVALCRDRLLRDALPAEEHDVPVGVVLTESLCLSATGQ